MRFWDYKSAERSFSQLLSFGDQNNYIHVNPYFQHLLSGDEIIKTSRLNTGCNPLDNMLGGGFEAGVVSQVYGAGGSGKTNICIQLAVPVSYTHLRAHETR